MSEYISQYTGEQIDEAVAKILGLDIKESGFIMVETDDVNPVDLNDFTLPKNYLIFHYVNGAKEDNHTKSPIALYVREILGEVIEQTYYANNTLYCRVKMKSDHEWGQWGINSSYYEALALILSKYPTINYNPVYIRQDDPVIDHPELNGMPYVWLKALNENEEKERDVLIQNKDENGVLYKEYPQTKWHNIISGIPALAVINNPDPNDQIEFETNDIEATKE